MHELRGVISDRLRKLFKPGDPVYSPQRPTQPAKAAPINKNVEGHKLGGRKK